MNRSVIFYIFLLIISSITSFGQDRLAARMLNNIIDINASYQGERLFVYGVIPDNCDLVVTVISKLDTCDFNYKGKRGPLWMNLGKISFINCPHMYKIKSTRPLSEILSKDTSQAYLIGFDAIKSQVKVKGVDNPVLYAEHLFNMRIEEGLYSDEEGIIEIHSGNLFDASFFWPSKAQIGKYKVEVFAVREGSIIGRVSEEVNVQKIGIEQWLSFHAAENGVLYGIVSALFALLFGVLITLVTRGIIFSMSARKPIIVKPEEGK